LLKTREGVPTPNWSLADEGAVEGLLATKRCPD